MNSLSYGTVVLAHSLMGFYFVFYAFWNIFHWMPILRTMNERGVPHPYLVLPVGIILQAVAGYFIMFGIYVKLSALLLIPFTIIAISIFHPFWKYKGELRTLNFSIFLVNATAVIGGLLLLIAPLNTLNDWLM